MRFLSSQHATFGSVSLDLNHGNGGTHPGTSDPMDVVLAVVREVVVLRLSVSQNEQEGS